MSVGIGSVATSYLHRPVGTKSAVKPGDVFTVADAAIPTGPIDTAAFLRIAGYVPDPAWAVMPWVTDSYFTYFDASGKSWPFWWSGTQWQNGKGYPIHAWSLNVTNPQNGTPVFYPKVKKTDMLAVLDYMMDHNVNPSFNNMRCYIDGLVIYWSGSQYVIQAYPPTTGITDGPKVLWPGQPKIGDININAQDQANADKLTGLGYTPAVTWPWVAVPALPTHYSVQFASHANNFSIYQFYWTGSAWAPGLSSTPLPGAVVTPRSVLSDPVIEGFPANERIVATSWRGWTGGANTWTPGQSATIAGGGGLMNWEGRSANKFWCPGIKTAV